jgi:hypothetical protein
VNIFSKVREDRRIAEEQRLAEARRALGLRAPLPSGVDADAYLREAQARATAAADAPLGSSGTRIGRVLPAAARKRAGLEVVNPKLWLADLRPVRRYVDKQAF